MNEIIVNLEGKEYQIDLERAKQLGVLKEKDQRCKSWEEFENKYRNKQGFCYNPYDVRIELTPNPIMTTDQLTENEAIAIKAFSKLLKLRRDWIGNWEPDWSNCHERKYCIEVYKGIFRIQYYSEYSRIFSFPTEKMAKEFLECFKHLFEDCKYLI